MSLFNKLVDSGSKFILIIIGLAIALLPIIHIFANETLYHQEWNPAFQKYQHRLKQVQQVTNLQIGYIFHNNSTQKSSALQFQETFQLADFICYNLLQKGETVVRKNLETKVKRRTKKNQEAQSTQEIATVTSLLQYPPLAFLKEKISKLINFEHQSLKSKHWVIVSFGELETKIQQEIQVIKQKHPQYKFIIVSPKPINSLSVQNYKAETVYSTKSQQNEKNKNAKGKKSKVKKVKVIEEEAEKPIQILQDEKVIQQNDL